jgi:hypothetical protein
MSVPDGYTDVLGNETVGYTLNTMNKGVRASEVKYIRDKNGTLYEWDKTISLKIGSITFTSSSGSKTTLKDNEIANIYGRYGQIYGGRKSSKRRSLRRSKKQRKSRKYKK